MRVHRSDKSFHLEAYLPNQQDEGRSYSESSSINSDEERRILDVANLVGLPDPQPKSPSSNLRESIGSDHEKEDAEPIAIISSFAAEENNHWFENNQEEGSGHRQRQEEKRPKSQWKTRCWRIVVIVVFFILLNTAILLTKLHQGRKEQAQPTPTTQSVQKEPTGSAERTPSYFPTPYPTTIDLAEPTTEAPTLEPTTMAPTLEPSAIAPTLEPTPVVFVFPGGFGFGGGTNLPPVRATTFPPTSNPTAGGTGGIKIGPIPAASSAVAPTPMPSVRTTPEPMRGFGFGGGSNFSPTRNTPSLAPTAETYNFGLVRRGEKPSASGLPTTGPVLPTSTAAPSR